MGSGSGTSNKNRFYFYNKFCSAREDGCIGRLLICTRNWKSNVRIFGKRKFKHEKYTATEIMKIYRNADYKKGTFTIVKVKKHSYIKKEKWVLIKNGSKTVEIRDGSG